MKISTLAVYALLLGGAAIQAGCSSSTSTPAQPTEYMVSVLASDNGTGNRDTSMRNTWGVTSAPSAPLFAVNNLSNTIGEYDLTTGGLRKTFIIPTTSLAGPSAIVYNSDLANYVISGNGPSTYIFASTDGKLAGLSVNNDIAVGYEARSGTASYTGLSLGSNGGATRLYAANFKNGSIDVFDGNFARLAQTSDNLTGSDKIPLDYAPFNVRSLNGTLYVTYAMQNGSGADNPGVGNGYIDIFNADGTFNKRFASKGTLNSPWGIAIAPDNFGDNKGKLLVGNTGDGTINIYDPTSGNYLGQLKNMSGATMVIDGLRDLYVSGGTLYYTASPGRTHGEIGTINVH